MPEATLGPFLSVPRIAYFSMEIALEPGIPTYSGGLGILAGDTMRSAVDLELPLVGVTLVSRAGYFKQEIVPPGRQVEHPERWDPATRARALGAKIAVSDEGKRLIESLHAHLRHLNGAVPGAFVPGYDMDTALLLVSGADLWLNTPLPPLEASGTSGMKAALNGVPNLSVLDGWWIEGWIEGVSGWAIGHDGPASAAQDHARSLYDKLEGTVLPLYYDDRPGWIKVMKGATGKNAFFFNSHRMMRRYAAEAYLRLAP